MNTLLQIALVVPAFLAMAAIWLLIPKEIKLWLRQVLKEFGKPIIAILFIAFTLVVGLWQPRDANAQSAVGLNTRWGAFSNNNFGPAFVPGTNFGYSNGVITLTNGQTLTIWTNGGAEVGLEAPGGLGVWLLVSSTNWANTNTVTFAFDTSIFGSTNKTASFTGPNTSFLVDGPYGNYTGCGTNTSGTGGSAFTNITVVIPGSNTVAVYIPISPLALNNARWFRWSSVTVTGQSTVGANVGQTLVQQVAWSKFP